MSKRCKTILKTAGVVAGAVAVSSYVYKKLKKEDCASLILINNTDENIKSISIYKDEVSGKLIDSDGCLIEPGKKLKIKADSLLQYISITNENDEIFNSDKLDIDLSKLTKPLLISIEKDYNNKWCFEIYQ